MDPRSLRPPVLSVVAALSIAPALLTWQDSVQVNDVSTGQQDRPDAAMSGGGTTYLIWDDYRTGGNGDIYVSLRDPVTGTWSANERVSDDPTGRTQWSSAIAVDGSGLAYAVWMDQRDGKKTPDTNIYFAKRAGGVWSANRRVNDDTRGTAHQATPRIAVTSAGDAVAVWGDHRSNQWNVYSSRLSAGGVAWSANLPVTDNGTSRKFDPDITIAPDGTAYAVWDDDRAGNSDVWFSKLLPGASSWTANERISDDPGTAPQYEPRIDVAGNGDLYVVWLDDRAPSTEVRMSRLPSAGGAWEASRVVSDAAAVPVNLALSVASDGSAIAVWQDARGSSYDIWGADYDLATDTWLTPAIVSDDPGATAQMRATVARTSSVIVAAWRDDRFGGADIRARASTSAGP